MPNAIINVQQDRVDHDARYLADIITLIRLGSPFALLVAAGSLTVGTIGGLIERRHPFALLRASGVHLGELRRVVLLETAVPMVFTTALGVGLGLATSYALARLNGMPWSPPDISVIAIIGAGVLAALALSTLALPLLEATTRPNAIRYE